MADQPYAQLVREAMEAFNHGDYDAFSALMADDVVWHTIGADEPLRGKAEMAKGLGGGGGDYSINAEVHAVTEGEGHVVVLANAHATRGDASLDYNTAEIFHVRDGLITERWAFSDDTARIVEFFG
jgi:ketosteroid isomerase-like protein